MERNSEATGSAIGSHQLTAIRRVTAGATPLRSSHDNLGRALRRREAIAKLQGVHSLVHLEADFDRARRAEAEAIRCLIQCD